MRSGPIYGRPNCAHSTSVGPSGICAFSTGIGLRHFDCEPVSAESDMTVRIHPLMQDTDDVDPGIRPPVKYEMRSNAVL